MPKGVYVREQWHLNWLRSGLNLRRLQKGHDKVKMLCSWCTVEIVRPKFVKKPICMLCKIGKAQERSRLYYMINKAYNAEERRKALIPS